MTLLTIGQAVADEVSDIRPQTIAGNTDPDVQKLLRFINKVGNKLMKKSVWQDLRKEQTFTAIAGAEQTSILPSDFDRFITDTFWDRTNNALITGPVSAVEWQTRQAVGSGAGKRFIYRGGSVFISPDMDGGEALAFEYVSNQWCASSGGTGQTAFAADTDVGVLDEELLTYAAIYEYLAAEGLPSADALRQLLDYVKTLSGNDQPRSGLLSAGDIFGGRHFTGSPGSGGGYNINYG
jgi:hypothetical protein